MQWYAGLVRQRCGPTVTKRSQNIDWRVGATEAIYELTVMDMSPMRSLILIILTCTAWIGANPVVAQERQVTVVELFTSQGCSSCPPAEAFLSKLTEYEDVLPLALHVDYWDYIGWEDTFAEPAFTERQKAYAYGFGERSIYTPQMIVGGSDYDVGSDVMTVMDMVHHHQAQPEPLQLSVNVADDGRRRLTVQNMSGKALADSVLIQLVHFIPEAIVEVEHGENAGHRSKASNVVTRIDALARWNASQIAEVDLPFPLAPDGQRAAIVVQAATKRGFPSRILAAIKLEN